MDITFASKQLEKDCNADKRLIRAYGAENAQRIRRRLDEMRAAPSLEYLRTLPQCECHELTGDRKGQFSVSVKHPYRLIFVPAHHPIPQKESGGTDWTAVTAV
ncbi:MAG TPA: type II toxin-antitoxin system RelE/ParE family toxin, partial [Anaerolineae bacterium]